MAAQTLDDKSVDLLEQRIAHLEGVLNSRKSGDKPILDLLLNANTNLSAAANSSSNVQEIYRRSKEVNKILAGETFVDAVSENENKLEVVLNSYERYKESAAALEQLAKFASNLDVENLKSLDELKPELAELMGEYTLLKQRFQGSSTCDDLPALFRALTSEVSKSLLAANDSLTQLESQSQT